MGSGTAEQKRAPLVHHQPLVAVLIAACLGIVIDRHAPLPVWVWCLFTVSMLIVWFSLRRRVPTVAGAVFVLLAVLSLAAAWHHLAWYLFNTHDIGRYAGPFPRTAALRVETAAPVKRLPPPLSNPLWTMPTGERSRVEVRTLAIRDGNQWRPAAGRAMLLVDGRLADLPPGTELKIFGRILRPPPSNNPGEFNFADYRRAQRQLCVLRTNHPACVTRLGQRSSGTLRNWFARLRARGSRLLWGYLAHGRAGLAAAVLLGEREQLEYDRTDAFIKTGTIHLLAISGLHIGILVSLLMVLLRFAWLPRGWLLLTIAILTIFYALLTDARPPVMRATVLVVVLCGAMAAARRSDAFNTLALAALVVLIWNPANLFRVGAQLSFLAVATLICLAPLLRRLREREREPLRQLIASTRPLPVRILRTFWLWFWQLAVAGLAVFLVALPLVMHHFHLFSPVGILLTPLLYLPVAVALASGLGVLLTGWILPPLAHVFAALCDASLGLLEWTVTAASQVPGSYAWMPGPPVWWLAVFYLALTVAALGPRLRPRPVRCAALLAVWLLVGIVAGPLTNGGQQLRCSFISVGQGCSVLLELPGGKALLYDAGRMGSPVAAVRAISATLWSQGRTHLDAIVISHADADHFNAIPEILERFSVGTVYVSPIMHRDKSEPVEILFSAIEQAGVPIRPLARGDRIAVGDATLTVLHPTPAGVEETYHGSLDNANSIVMLAEQAERKILLTGDLESAGLETLLALDPIDCDVILAPHHGSRNSRPAAFARWSRPEWTIISSGLEDPPVAVREAYGGPGRELIHTGSAGAVVVLLSGDRLQITRQRAGRPGKTVPTRPAKVP
jgi:competence protein ComEC